MKRKDYNQCSSATDLFVRAMQNAIGTFMRNERIIHSLEEGNYLYHKPLSNALSDTANMHMVFRAAFEIERYCIEHQDCRGELANLFIEEMRIAITTNGLRIHALELKRHGRKIHKPLNS